MPKNKIDIVELAYKQKGRCYWCKGSMVFDDPSSPFAATREHLIPQSRGGTNVMKVGTGKKRRRIKNVVAACRKCNSSRGNMDAHVFKSTMRPHIQ